MIDAIRDWPRTVRRQWHVRGRRAIGGQRLRYDLCTAIPLAVLELLREFVADCESPFFHCVHDDDLATLRPLIAEGERIARGEYDDECHPDDAAAWADWLKRVTDVLPRLWD